MVLQLFIGLLVIAAASLLITQGRRRRIWSVLILAGLCGVSYFLLDGLSHSSDTGFIYQWLPYKALKADFNISSSARMQQMFLPLICLLAASVYFNTISVSEQHSLHFNTLMLFNFIGLILLASGHDFIQLMFACSMLSVISFYMPDLSASKRKIFVFNFLAEMSVFMALAIVYGKTRSVSLEILPEYVRNGWHKDLVGGLLLFSIGCKSGLFLLNGQYFSLKDVAFNRTAAVLSLSVPLSGLILAAKLQPILQASNLVVTILPWWIGASVGAAVFGALLSNHLKIKAVALSLGGYAVLLWGIYNNITILYNWVPMLLILNFLIIIVFVLAFNAASEETSVLRMGGFWRLTKINFALSFLVVASVVSVLTLYFPKPLSLAVVCGYLAVIGIILRMIYWGKTRAAEKVESFAKSCSILYAMPLLVGAIGLIWQSRGWERPLFGIVFGGVILVFCAFPVRWLMWIGNFKIWRMDILTFIYETFFIMPLKFFGRILWLAFDVVFIERNVIGSVSAVTSAVVNGMHRRQEIKTENFVLGILLGILLMAVYLGAYIYE